MTRFDAFDIISKHIFHAKEYARLKQVEREMCLQFIRDNDNLDFNAFAEKTNRWLLDRPKPKNYSIMWALVLQANQIWNRDRKKE